MKNFYRVILIIGIILSLSSCGPGTIADPSTDSTTPAGDVTQGTTDQTIAAMTRVTISAEDTDIVLQEKDFLFTSKSYNFTVWAMMDKETCLSVLPPADPDDPNENGKISVNGVVDYGKQSLWIAGGELLKVTVDEEDGTWEGYKGIDSESTINDVIAIYGQPTFPYTQKNIPFLYVFYKTETGEYKKLKNIEEYTSYFKNNIAADTFEINDLRDIRFFYDAHSLKLSGFRTGGWLDQDYDHLHYLLGISIYPD